MSEPPAGPDAGRISRRHFLGLGAAGLGAALLMSRVGRRRLKRRQTRTLPNPACWLT